METRFGNLVKEAEHGMFDVVLHGCNTHNTMGAGIAKTIKDVWPGAFEADTMAYKSSKAKLGNISVYEHRRQVDASRMFVLNCYTQDGYGRGKRNADYEAIMECFEKASELIKGFGSELRVGIPLIGCGLAGGDWRIVEKMAEIAFEHSDCKIKVVKFPEPGVVVENSKVLAIDVMIHGNIVGIDSSNPAGKYPVYELDGVEYGTTNNGIELFDKKFLLQQSN